jgi:hypothetical protein
MNAEPVYEEIPEDNFALLTKADLRNYDRRLRSDLAKLVTQIGGVDQRQKKGHAVKARALAV